MKNILLIGAVVAACLVKYIADMDAIKNEFELVWDNINELQGVDPAKVGEPIAD